MFEKHMRNCQMSVVQRNTFTYHMEEMTGNTFIYISRNDKLLETEPSG